MDRKILIVIGGGAAGFFCAVNAAAMNPMLKVLILEKTNKVLSKVKVSGGGRCNVTHHCFEINDLIKHYPRGYNFLKKAFHHFNPKDTFRWFESKGVALKVEQDGRVFPLTNSSQTIIDCLLKEANKYGVEILMNYEVTSIEKQDERFLLSADNQKISADYLCIATGGYPKMMQFNWLEQLGHTIETPVPSLFTFNIPSHNFAQLMGISVDNAVVKISGTKLQQQGAVLITHWGLSGPAVLKLSAWGARILNEKNYHFSITVNWLGDRNESQLRDEWIMFRQKLSSQLIQHGNPFQIPSRLWLYLLKESFIEKSTRWAEVTSKQQNQLIKNLTAFELQVKGKTTFKEEFVTCGGIALHEVDVNLMQSKKMKQLFLAGEVLDVDGITGGFNFQNAWTTAWIAANAIAKLSEI